MAVEYNTTIFIEENDRIPYNIETARKGTKTYNTAVLLNYFYNQFQEILNLNGRITLEDLEQVYNEKPQYIENSYYMKHFLFDKNAYKYYYISSRPFKQKNDIYVRIELTCPICGEKYTPLVKDLSKIQRCYCQYLNKVVPKNIEHLKQTDELYLKHHKNPIGNTTYLIDDISCNYYSTGGLQYTYIIKCTKCNTTKEVTCNSLKKSYINCGEYNLFSKNPPCNCNQHLGFKAADLRLQEIENELLKSEYYIKDSLKRTETSKYSIQYICKECGTTQESIVGYDRILNHNFICKSCALSKNGKINVYSMLHDFIPWSDEDYFNKNIKNNQNFFNDKFMAIDFLENQYNERGQKIYKFRHINKGCEFEYSASNMYQGDLKFCAICEQDVKDSYGVLNIKTYLKQNKIPYIEDKPYGGCCNPKTHYNLRFDFRIPTNNDPKTFIEFDGEQHIIGWGGNEESLKEIQYRDYIKNNYCYERNYILLRIPHNYDSLAEITKILDEFFRLLNNNDTPYTPQPIYHINGNNIYIYDFIIYKGLENFQATREYLQKHKQYTNPNLSAIDF